MDNEEKYTTYGLNQPDADADGCWIGSIIMAGIVITVLVILWATLIYERVST